jgi:hypothetical protein
MAETIVSALIGDAVSRVISLLTGRFSVTALAPQGIRLGA